MLYEHETTGLQVHIRLKKQTETSQDNHGHKVTQVVSKELVTDAGQSARFVDGDENIAEVATACGIQTLCRVR
jgi:hypothetical protein